MHRLVLYIQKEDGVEITLGTENYLFSLFCMKNSFVCATPSSRFAFVDLKVSIYVYSVLYMLMHYKPEVNMHNATSSFLFCFFLSIQKN